MSDRIKIELKPYHRGPDSNTFTGRSSGEQVRKELKLDSIDNDGKLYDIFIPKETTSFNPSFFLGLFFNSIKSLKGYDKFENKYSIIILEENIDIKEGLVGDFQECKRQAINEFNHKTGLSL